MFGLELELVDCTTCSNDDRADWSAVPKKLFETKLQRWKKGTKYQKNCVLVFGKVKQNSDGEVRILLGKWSNLLGRWSNLLGKWSKFDGEMKQNDGQMKQNLMGRCPIDKVHTTRINSVKQFSFSHENSTLFGESHLLASEKLANHDRLNVLCSIYGRFS